MVRDGVIIASQMVVIAGQRLRHLIVSSDKSIQIIALITPVVKEWCKSLVSMLFTNLNWHLICVVLAICLNLA